MKNPQASQADDVSLGFRGLERGRVAPGWQTVFTRRLEVEEKISDGQQGKGSDGTGARAALSRGFESLTLAGAIERNWSAVRGAWSQNKRGDAD